jgi:hypothetical protein
MLHGQMLPCYAMPTSTSLSLPDIGTEVHYIDWRKMFEGHIGGFAPSEYIAKNAFDTVINFLEHEWKKNLL